MCDIDTAVNTINRFIDQYYFEASPSWNELEFKQRSYQRWAAYEICYRIMDHPFDDPIDIVENFMIEMSIYSNYEDEANNFIFQIGYETAEEIALLFV